MTPQSCIPTRFPFQGDKPQGGDTWTLALLPNEKLLVPSSSVPTPPTPQEMTEPLSIFFPSGVPMGYGGGGAGT